jgi:hypothetical protein
MFVPSGGLDGELIHLEPLGRVGGPVVLLDPQRLEVQGPTYPLQVMRERLDPPFIASLSWRTVLVRLVIIRAMITIVPLMASFALDTILFLVPVFNPVACIFVVNDIMQVPFIPILEDICCWSSPHACSSGYQGHDPASCLRDQGMGQQL